MRLCRHLVGSDAWFFSLMPVKIEQIAKER
jgi:hypothetical protein